MPDLSGIYKITNIVNGRFYIGSAVNIKKRWAYHKEDLRKLKHGNSYLQRAWNKYGGENFIFEILEHCNKENLIKREQHYIDVMEASNKGYNICSVAGSKLGTKMPKEAIEKSRIKNIGKIISGDARQKISVANKGKVRTPEMRAKYSAAKIGISFTDEHKAKLLIARHKRGPVTDETKKKMALAATGKKRPKSDETRAKMSIIMKARIMPEEERLQRSELMKGNVPSETTRRKLSEATMRQWAKHREINGGGGLCRIS